MKIPVTDLFVITDTLRCSLDDINNKRFGYEESVRKNVLMNLIKNCKLIGIEIEPVRRKNEKES